LKSLARSLSEPELDTLARYLSGLASAPRERILKTVARSPGPMQVLAAPRVRDGIIASRDQAAAVEMMLSTSGPLDVAAALHDAELVSSGRIAPILLWERRPALVIAAGMMLVIVLLLLRRLFTPRRKPPAPGTPVPGVASA
jgi:hypothetical protein